MSYKEIIRYNTVNIQYPTVPQCHVTSAYLHRMIPVLDGLCHG